MAMPMDVYNFAHLDHAVSSSKDNGNNEKDDVPVARSGHRIVVTDGNLYSLGGYNPEYWQVENTEDTNYPLFKELWRFNFVTRRWKKLNTKGVMPLELASHAALRHNNNLLAFGGTGVPFGESSSNDLHVCNLGNLTWQHFQCSGDQPEKKYGHAMLLVDKYLYVCGGTTGFFYNMDVHRLDLNKLVWEKLSSDDPKKLERQPESRYRHEMAFHNNKLYIFGGGTAMNAFRFELIPTFNINDRDWEQTPAVSDRQHGYPSPRRCHSCCQLDKEVYMCGGMDGVKILPDFWRFTLDTHHWTKLKHEMPLPVYFHSADLAPNGCLYIFGGVSAIDNVRTSEVYRTWIRVPSLVELAWNSVVSLLPNPGTVNKHQLAQIGIPAHLVERIS